MALSRFLLPCLFLVLLAPQARADDATHFKFDGELTGGQDYSHELPNGLVFQLLATAEGWTIYVNTKLHAERDQLNFADITPPLHGPSALNIQGSDFQKPAKTPDIDEEGDEAPSASPDDHEFQFALSATDREAVWSDYNCASSGDDDNSKCDDGRLPKLLGYGTVHVSEHTLGNPAMSGQPASIEHMKFTVSGDYEAPRGMDE